MKQLTEAAFCTAFTEAKNKLDPGQYLYRAAFKPILEFAPVTSRGWRYLAETARSGRLLHRYRQVQEADCRWTNSANGPTAVEPSLFHAGRFSRVGVQMATT